MAFVSYIEFNVSDTKRSAEFYKQVFGWEAKLFSQDNDYLLVAHGSEPGIDAGIQKAQGAPATVAVVTVPNLDEIWQKAMKAGAKVAVPKFPIPTVGYAAYFTDPDGLVIGIHQYDENAK
jgi:predicted enzyme related to lactoylglutathione lyase